MKTPLASFAAVRRVPRGVAAVELTIIIVMCWVLFPLIFLVGRLLYDYTVLRQAAHDAAMYAATVPAVDYKTLSSAALVGAQADAIVRRTVAATAIRPDSDLSIVVLCDNFGCGNVVPQTINVKITYAQDFSLFVPYYGRWLSEPRWYMRVEAAVPYTN